MTISRHRAHNRKIGFQKQNERSVIERTKRRAQGMSAEGQGPQGLGATPASPVGNADAPKE